MGPTIGHVEGIDTFAPGLGESVVALVAVDLQDVVEY